MGAPRYEIAIDGHCGFCKKSAGWLKALDWRDAIRIQEVHEPGMVEMRVTRLEDRRTLGGFDGFRMFARSVPALMPLWPVLWVPGVPAVGRRVYRWIAAHRRELPGGCGSEACALPPPKT